MKFLKVQRRLFRDAGRELTRPEYERLLETAKERGQDRLVLLMEAICATGIRVSEVRYITVEAAQRGRAEISLKGKIRTILLPRKLCRKLLKYAKKNKTVSGEIFLTRNGTSLSRRQIWAELKRLCKYAGVEPSKVFPHNLRHLFATHFLQSLQGYCAAGRRAGPQLHRDHPHLSCNLRHRAYPPVRAAGAGVIGTKSTFCHKTLEWLDAFHYILQAYYISTFLVMQY